MTNKPNNQHSETNNQRINKSNNQKLLNAQPATYRTTTKYPTSHTTAIIKQTSSQSASEHFARGQMKADLLQCGTGV
jgi:hypothetical protein